MTLREQFKQETGKDAESATRVVDYVEWLENIIAQLKSDLIDEDFRKRKSARQYPLTPSDVTHLHKIK